MLVANPHHRFIKELPVPESRPVVNRHVELIINMDSRHDSIVRLTVIKGCDRSVPWFQAAYNRASTQTPQRPPPALVDSSNF